VSLIYKILERSAWLAAKAAGEFAGSGIDLVDGYIHFSTRDQVSETARRHFAGQAGLVTLEIEGDDLGQDLVWEPSRGGDLFPHLYGRLAVDRVLTVRDAPLDGTGIPIVELD